jgi:hypothetical protein
LIVLYPSAFARSEKVFWAPAEKLQDRYKNCLPLDVPGTILSAVVPPLGLLATSAVAVTPPETLDQRSNCSLAVSRFRTPAAGARPSKGRSDEDDCTAFRPFGPMSSIRATLPP